MALDSKCSTITSLESLDTYLSQQDNSENSLYVSGIPEICKTSPCILGIDEAGRGPVLGPMVYGIAFCPAAQAEVLKKLECVDSKDLNEEKRDKIFSKICGASDSLGWAVEVISPNKICNGMLSRVKHSLNAISMDSAIGLIKAVAAADVNIEHIYVDTVGPADKYQAYLLSIFPNYNITVAKKADSTYPIVSAASICAKVTRDHSLHVWKFKEGFDFTYKDFGSGYPGDPVTKKFLVEQCDPVFGFPQLVRFSWSTARNILEKQAYDIEWNESQDEPDMPKGVTSVASFFKMTGTKQPKKKAKHEFFTQRGLSSEVEF